MGIRVEGKETQETKKPRNSKTPPPCFCNLVVTQGNGDLKKEIPLLYTRSCVCQGGISEKPQQPHKGQKVKSTMDKKEIAQALETLKNQKQPRGAWARGVRAYALEILEGVLENLEWKEEEGQDADFYTPKQLEKIALNGAQDWRQYSEGGCSLVCTRDIVDRLCNKTEKQRFWKNPDKYQELEWQSRALFQAWLLIRDTLWK